MKRLHKFLAECGVDSRRKCELLIQQGRVFVNGEIIQSQGKVIDEKKAVVTVDGREVSAPKKFTYILLNKPKGYVTTVRDELNRKTVIDLIPDKVRVFPIGRLDKETMGALLLTNDGELAFQLTHPKFNVEKTYHVTLSLPITKKGMDKIQSGIMLEDGITRPCKAKVIQDDKKKIELTLQEGRKREIRRMFQALGYRVLELTRIQFASLSLTGLNIGEWRYLTRGEIDKLKMIVPGEK